MADANSKSGSNYVRYVNIRTSSDMRDGRALATLETALCVAPRAAASQLERFTGSNEPIKSRFTSAARDVTEQQWRAVDEGEIWRRLASPHTGLLPDFCVWRQLICVATTRHGI